MKYDKENIVVLGNGFLGQAFENRGYYVTDRSIFDYPLTGNANIDQLSELPTSTKVIINTIAYTNTKSAEYDINKCLRLNMQLPKILSSYCDEVGYKFVHISSGCVYQHSHIYDKYTENSPLSVYISSKLLGDKMCGPNDLIIRPRLLFGSFNHKNNLLTKLKGFDSFLDEQNSITSVHTIIDSIEVLLNSNKTGIYNVAQIGTISMHEIAGYMYNGVIKYESYQDMKQSFKLISPNIELDISKLREVYVPNNVHDEIKYCLSELK